MNLEVSISERAAAWLEQKARAAGLDEASMASTVLEEAAADHSPGRNGNKSPESINEWIRLFDQWTASLIGRGGLANPSRTTIYE